MLDKIILTPLKLLSAAIGIANNTENFTASGGSLIGYTRSTRVEPIVMLDQSIQHLPYTEEVLKALLAIFSAYYLQAVAISVNVGKINTIKLFDHLNPDRIADDGFQGSALNLFKGMGAGLESIALTDESTYANGLPAIRHNRERLTLEAVNINIPLPQQGSNNERGFIHRSDADSATIDSSWVSAGVAPGAKVGKSLNDGAEAGNLVVGNLLEVNIESEGHKATIPVMVRLLASPIRNDVLVHILSKNERDLSIRERWHDLMSGQIAFFKDFMFCQDLIDEHQATLMKDGTDQYAEILKRRQKNRNAAWVTKKPSAADASNIIVMSETTRNAVEAACGGRLKDYKTRQRIFDATYLMLLVVVDVQWETVTIYHRGIALPTVVSVKAMKLGNKKGGTDIGEILKAYQLGNAPTY